MKFPRRAFIALLLTAFLINCAAETPGPPNEPGASRVPDLVELTEDIAGMRLDVRYATEDNFVGRAVYPEARVFLQRPAAEALLRVRDRMKAHGLGLLLFDGYRPWRVTKLFWDVTPVAQRHFVADPAKGSRHNRGCAVDLSLYVLATQQAVLMPTGYDDFTEAAHVDYPLASKEATAMRELLKEAMVAEGFSTYSHEWWHFDHALWRLYPIIDVSFEELARSVDTLSDH